MIWIWVCDCARALTRLFHKDDLFFDTRKVYYELGYLDDLLGGRIPLDVEACRMDANGRYPKDEIETLYRQTLELTKPVDGH